MFGEFLPQNERVNGIFGSSVAVTGQPGFYRGISNADYHAGPGYSKSQLDLVNESPALLPWSKTAPEDEAKKASLNLGEALHTLLLEPERFSAEYAVGPANAPRNTNKGKAKWEEFEAALQPGQIVISGDEFNQLKLMRESVFAHPQARWLIEAEGDAEASIYWKDPETSLLCRIRPDKIIHSYRCMLDVKSTADIRKFVWSIRDYRYHVQDAFYTEGFNQHFDEQLERFLFLAVSTSIDCGRYPVRIFELDEAWKMRGVEDMRRNLATIQNCEQTNDWPGIQVLSAPERKSY